MAALGCALAAAAAFGGVASADTTTPQPECTFTNAPGKVYSATVRGASPSTGSSSVNGRWYFDDVPATANTFVAIGSNNTVTRNSGATKIAFKASGGGKVYCVSSR
ncbi:hypothetical protein [Lentzea sp. HUAS12]|uniref:hypothetical protein n=1 Tax=Lentzea sp. HUAS12 TaxID=2951806 RepID=UPI00209D17B6|nr:hypothetical protein [Lentzea sp. HUAS12]USX56365.1 hypothetical protein ND450_20360 [Lentzea sp. HUAS12]